jgi:fatty acid amide hydrolase 2
MPAFFNGVFGHKCSPGLISNEGQFPLPTGNADDLLSTGPLCRKAEDLEPLLRILMGEKSSALQPVSSVDISQLRVFTLAPDRGTKADNDQQTAQQNAVRLLQEAGAKVATLDLPLFDKSFDLWSALISTGGGSHFAAAMFGSTAPWHPLWEMGKLLFRRSSHTLPLVSIALVEQLPHLFPKRTQRFVAQAALLKQQLEEALGDDGVLVTIPYPEPAPLHGMPILPPLTFGWTRCAIFNALKVPSTAIPMGLNAQNLPTGVQIVAKQNNDHLSLACALALEKLTGGWTPPHSLK